MKSMPFTALVATAAVALMLFAVGCDEQAPAENAGVNNNDHHHHAPASIFGDVAEAVAVVHPTEGNEAHGWVRFTARDGGGVRVTAELQGLNAGQRHGFHVHEFGDCTAPDGTSAGSHYNPGDHPHGLPNDGERHAGDFGNLEADDQGTARFELDVDNLSVAGHDAPVIGRAVIVHRDEDDGSQPLGDAGPRIGCGVIGVAQPAEEE